MTSKTWPIVLANLGVVSALFLAAAHAELPPDLGPPAVSAPPAPVAASKIDPPRPAPSLAAADTGVVCFENAVWLNPCHRGGLSLGEKECEPGPPKGKKLLPPRFRLGKGPWTELSPTRWRCVPLPIGRKTMVAIRDQADKTVIAASCVTRRVDVSYNDFYGGISAHCSRRRKVQQDEFLPDYLYNPPEVPEGAGTAAK